MFTRSIAIIILLSWIALPAEAQYSPPYCTWPPGAIPVYYFPGAASANGFNADRFREELVDAIGVWNAESMGNIDLYYAGDTTGLAVTGIPGQITVQNVSQFGGASNRSACSIGTCASGVLIDLYMQEQNGAVRGWRTGYAGYPYSNWGAGGSRTSYTGVLVHELGHALGLDDQSAGTVGGFGVMEPVGSPTAYYHLYDLDADAISAAYGRTSRKVQTSNSVSGSSWSSPSLVSGTFWSSVGPGIDGNRPSSSTPLTFSNTATFGSSRSMQFLRGDHASSTARPSPPGSQNLLWRSVANSTYGETLIAWPGACSVYGHQGCDVFWAWTNNDGSTWTTGTLTDVATFSKVAIEYDGFRDRFVMAYLTDADGRIMTRSTHAAGPANWGSATASPAYHYRHLGGMIFDPAGPSGLLVASSDSNGSTKNRLIQWQITASGSGSAVTYLLSSATYLTSPSELAHTRRPFGIAHDPGPNNTMVVWRDTGAPRGMAFCTMSGYSSGTSCSAPTVPITGIINGVDLAYDPPGNVFVAAFTYF